MNKFTIDTTNRLFIAKSGITSFDATIDLYSDAKEAWLASADVNKYRFPILPVGGNVIEETSAASQYVSPYFFLRYGWRLRPQEANHVLVVNGNLLVESGSASPFVNTVGAYNVRIEQRISSDATTTVVETGVSGLTQAESDQLFALPTLSKIIGALLAFLR